MSSLVKDEKKVSVKHDATEESNRIRLLQDEITALKRDVKEALEQIELHRKTQQESRAAAHARVTLCWVVVLVCVFLLALLLFWFGSVFREDTVLIMNVKATPRTGLFRFVAVETKTEFTVGDVLETMVSPFTQQM